MKIRVTFDQFDNDEELDYGIVNAYWGNNHVFDVFYCESVEFDGIEKTVMFLTGLKNVKLTKMPFNPYGDGFEWVGHTL